MVKRKFKRQCFWLKKLGEKWIKPRGRQSKLRHEKKGRWAVPKIGYGRPNDEKFTINIKGDMKKPVMIFSPKDLEKIDPKTQAGMISATVGERKAIIILESAKAKGIIIKNRKLKKAKKEEKK